MVQRESPVPRAGLTAATAAKPRQEISASPSSCSTALRPTWLSHWRECSPCSVCTFPVAGSRARRGRAAWECAPGPESAPPPRAPGINQDRDIVVPTTMRWLAARSTAIAPLERTSAAARSSARCRGRRRCVVGSVLVSLPVREGEDRCGLGEEHTQTIVGIGRCAVSLECGPAPRRSQGRVEGRSNQGTLVERVRRSSVGALCTS